MWIAAVLYRRLFGREGRGALWAAGLAALLYALDDAHSLSTAYLANRNALLATFFGLLSLYCHVRWRDDGRAAPRRARVLSHGSTDVRVARVGGTALLVEPVGGLFPDPFSRYHRSKERPFQVGDTVDLGDLRIEVLEVDPDGRGPSSIRYDFNEPLEAERYLWMVWNGNYYEEWRPPVAGNAVVLPSRPGIFE